MDDIFCARHIKQKYKKTIKNSIYLNPNVASNKT